ncbi:uncharacterized protein K460DRAFT_360894 [Cucurbitaria berberidis CBS 394.84]|uniref:Uncharacterized protein n=1 Tax=Cucurbitaria berberidis CBS 394.84 TaxID=1168544 RepID=A0A9P4LCU0_9PLEO|nr:uncharacterized protein K460DRAFT_360894 [Cucurbitaria berberidis CBS 394.84]KAF1850028.1 hypothetical protein K460DRAFT_360894 [Cucurbitaria berberidis CBS 394.84]
MFAEPRCQSDSSFCPADEALSHAQFDSDLTSHTPYSRFRRCAGQSAPNSINRVPTSFYGQRNSQQPNYISFQHSTTIQSRYQTKVI